jgi:hypothetical protein
MLPENLLKLKKLKTLILVGNDFSDDEKTRITKALPKTDIRF